VASRRFSIAYQYDIVRILRAHCVSRRFTSQQQLEKKMKYFFPALRLLNINEPVIAAHGMEAAFRGCVEGRKDVARLLSTS